MRKIKHLFSFMILAALLFSCSSKKEQPQVLFAVSLPPGMTDSEKLQAGIDSCIKNGIPVFDVGWGKYNLNKGLVAAKWDSVNKKYVPFTLKIKGYAQMWDVNAHSVFTASFKDAPILAIHLGKGCSVEGINFQGAYRTPANVSTDSAFFRSNIATYGDTTCRDKPYSPYCAIAIDPFSPTVPADSGYPSLRHMYRGIGSGGSTGYKISNCTFNNVTIGLMLSPSGMMANCELMSVEDIRIYNTKIGICGSQAQEKSNIYYNINCWGRTHTLFNWGGYGTGTPGLTYIDKVQVAGGVVRLVNRVSGGYFPLIMTRVFTEMLGQIGQWQSGVGDKLSDATIGFAPVDVTKCYPEKGHIYGQGNGKIGFTIENSNLRYYGKYTTPILLNGAYMQASNNISYVPPMWGYKGLDVNPGYTMVGLGYTDSMKLPGKYTPGTFVTYNTAGSWIWEGMGQIGPDSSTIIYSSPNIKKGINYGIMKYVKS